MRRKGWSARSLRGCERKGKGNQAARAVWACVGAYTILIVLAWIEGGLMDPSLWILGALLVVIVLAFGGVGAVLSI